ncbi:MAG: hypothetical protein GY788_03480, partial [bacterium]|nr:hypothetical protein [bacterium]
TDFAIAMLAPLLIAQLPAIAGWAAGQAATVSQAAAAACANRCPAVTRWIANAGEEAVECGMSLSDGAQWIDSIDCTLALIGTRASVETGGGAPPPGERAVGYSNDGYVYRGVATNTADDLVPRRPGPGTPHVDDLPGAQSLFDLPKNATILDDFNEIARRLDVNHGIPRVTASERLHEIKAASGLGGADNVLFGPTGDVWDPVTGDWLGSLTAGGAP